MPMEKRGSVFTRHPIKTRLIVTAISVLLVDHAAGAVRRHLHNQVVTDEKSYRIRSEIYNHGLAANRVIPAAVWGPRRHKLVTNSLGFKDGTTRQVPMVPSGYRIVFIGDSFTEGVGIEYADTYVGRVATALNDRNIDVLNAAVASYSPKLYLAKVRYLVDIGLRFNELFVAIDISDPSDDIAYHRVGKVYTDRPPEPKSVAQQIKDGISNNTVLMYFLMKSAKDFIAPPRETEHWRSRWTDDGGYLNHHTLGLELNSKNMDELAALLSQHQIRLNVAVYPHPRQIKAGRLDSLAVRHWRQWAGAHYAGFVDLFPRFIDGRDWRDVVDAYFIPGDIHMNEQGHEILATSFLDHIRRHK